MTSRADPEEFDAPRSSLEGVTLARVREFVASRADDWYGAVALAYTPASAVWLRVDEAGRMSTGPGAPASWSWDHVWELTLFTAERQLRWVHDSAGGGTVALLDDARAAADGLSPLAAPSRRLLWGACTGQVAPRWVQMSSQRVASQWVPVAPRLEGVPTTAPRPGQRVALLAVEYTSRDQHGNVAVAAERLAATELVGEEPR